MTSKRLGQAAVFTGTTLAVGAGYGYMLKEATAHMSPLLGTMGFISAAFITLLTGIFAARAVGSSTSKPQPQEVERN